MLNTHKHIHTHTHTHTHTPTDTHTHIRIPPQSAFRERFLNSDTQREKVGKTKGEKRIFKQIFEIEKSGENKRGKTNFQTNFRN